MKTCKTLFFLLLICFAACKNKSDLYTISVSNNSNVDRGVETIEISLSELENSSEVDHEQLSLLDSEGSPVLSQLIDIDKDNTFDYIIFQVKLKAMESKTFQLVKESNNVEVKKSDLSTFCRFVPERIDDFAWENDRVAFRAYGPKAQEMAESGNPAGIISSGIDCWLKRVNYPIVNKWYAKHDEGKSYHIDEGEGLDNYHVGTSRGCGGTAIEFNDEQYLSSNYTKWNVISNGPIRTVFELVFNPIKIDDIEITEIKRFTIDLGSNFYKCDVSFGSPKPILRAKVGITLHNGTGEVKTSFKDGWYSYWEPLDDSYLGTGILLHKENVEVKDIQANNHLWASVKPKNNSYTYWAGFGWKKAGLFTTQKEWIDHLRVEAEMRNNPLSISITKN